MEFTQEEIKHIGYLEENYYNLLKDGNAEAIIAPYIKRIINMKPNKIPKVGLKLLLKHEIATKCMENSAPVCAVTFEDMQDYGLFTPPSQIRISTKCLDIIGNIFGDDNFPFYNKYTTNIEKILALASHECEHYLQYLDYKNKKFSKKSYIWTCSEIMREYVSRDVIIKFRKIFDEYRTNHGFKEIETQAFIHGWHDAGQFLYKYGYKLTSGINQSIGKVWWLNKNREQLAIQHEPVGVIEKNENGTKTKEFRMQSSLIDTYNVKKLIECVGAHYYLVKEYPILKNFFKENGTCKSADELIQSYCHLEDEYQNNPRGETRQSVDEKKEIYRDFLHYKFRTDDIQLPKDEKRKGLYATVCKDLILYDSISLQSAFDYNPTGEIKSLYEGIIRIKINRMLKIANYLQQLDSTKTIQDELKTYIEEMCRVYETSKLMYKDRPANIDTTIDELKLKLKIVDEFGKPKKIAPRNIEGRESAINI